MSTFIPTFSKLFTSCAIKPILRNSLIFFCYLFDMYASARIQTLEKDLHYFQLCVCLCVHVNICASECRYPQRSEEYTLSLEMELQVVVSHPTQVLITDSISSARTVHVFNCPAFWLAPEIHAPESTIWLSPFYIFPSPLHPLLIQ